MVNISADMKYMYYQIGIINLNLNSHKNSWKANKTKEFHMYRCPNPVGSHTTPAPSCMQAEAYMTIVVLK